MDLAERLLTNDKLKGEDRFAAHMNLAKAYIESAADKAKEHLGQVAKLIEEHSFPADMEEREIKSEEYRREHYAKVFDIQLKFDLEGAYQTAQVLGNTEYLFEVAREGTFTQVNRANNLKIAQKALGALDAQFDKLPKYRYLRLLEAHISLINAHLHLRDLDQAEQAIQDMSALGNKDTSNDFQACVEMSVALKRSEVEKLKPKKLFGIF